MSMMTKLTSKKIIKAIGCDKLTLHRGQGYWYFIYDDIAGSGKYDSRSVMTMYLGNDLGFWIAEGKDFLAMVNRS